MEKLIKVWANKGVYNKRLYFISNWKDNFLNFFRQRIFRKERANYGVSSKDVWAFDTYFYEMLHNAFIIYKKNTNGYPGMLTPKEWENVLNHMIFLCDELMKDESNDSEKIWEQYENSNYTNEGLRKEWLIAVEKFNEYQIECRYELMDLLKEWLPHIWW